MRDFSVRFPVCNCLGYRRIGIEDFFFVGKQSVLYNREEERGPSGIYKSLILERESVAKWCSRDIQFVARGSISQDAVTKP
jgi:hypothetical protein